MDLLELSKTAIKAAIAAGNLIKNYLKEEVEVQHKDTGSNYASQVVTIVDKKCEEIILSHLRPSIQEYDLAVLAEETEDDGSRIEKDFFWCIDPMDGTLPFIERRPGFSVSIALVAKDGTPFIGVVYDPSTDTLYHAIKGGGAFRNNNVWTPERSNSYLTYVTDRKLEETKGHIEIDSWLQSKAEQLGLNEYREVSGYGSVLNAILVAENGPACMFKQPKEEHGGGSIWDFAASACIFNELGLSATTYAGNQLGLNKKGGTFMNEQGVFYSNF